MASTRGRRVKFVGNTELDSEVFWMSLDEAKKAISEKYEYLAERYERRKPKNKE